MTWLSDLDDAAGQVTCSLLGNDGVNAALWATVSAAIAIPEPASTVSGALAGLGLIALQNGCNYRPDSGTPTGALQVGCAQASPGDYGFLYRINAGGTEQNLSSKKISAMSVGSLEPNEGSDTSTVTIFLTLFPSDELYEFSIIHNPGAKYTMRLANGGTCQRDAIGIAPNPPAQTVTGTTANCSFKVEFKSWFTGPEGVVQPVYKISSEQTLRTEDGDIGGCSFDPIVYIGTGGGRIGGSPPPVGPWNPEWDLPSPDGSNRFRDGIAALIGGAAGGILYDGIKDLLEAPYSGVEYRIDPSCPSSGSDPELPVVVEIPALKGEEAILTRLDALVPLLQAQKDLKQPICNVRPTREGEWRTISFRSEETSPFGSGRLRKRFRYLSLSGIGLEQLVDYWAGFSFEAGGVIVSHIGASWGEPKVWASTADEGKRVIRHAGGEAGLDPDQVGQWQISSSRNPRFGVSGTMNVDTTGGYYWITARVGSSERPIVAKT